MAGSRNGNLVLSDMVLKAAKAETYTQTTISKGAVNKAGDFLRSPFTLLSCTSKTHGAIDKKYLEWPRQARSRTIVETSWT